MKKGYLMKFSPSDSLFKKSTNTMKTKANIKYRVLTDEELKEVTGDWYK